MATTSTMTKTLQQARTGANNSTQNNIPAQPPEDLEPATIDELIRCRAIGDTGDLPIIAYPSDGRDYVYYTPKQVR